MAIYVCISCSDTPRGCTHITDNSDMLPILCGPDNQGYTRCCKWMEVPKKDKKILGFPDQLARHQEEKKN